MGKMTILITGVSGGIGKYLFDRFNQKNQEVYGTYFKNQPRYNKINSVLSKVDISKFHEVKNWMEKLKLADKKIVLINSTGINYNCSLHKSDPELWKNVIEINLNGTYHLIRNILPYMRENGYGRIINFSSVVAQKHTPGTSAYSASKAALWGLCRSVAAENGNKNITVNNINLGYFETGMISEVPEEFKQEILKQIPKNQFGPLEDIYSTVNYIIDTPYLNGTSIDINGGLY
jgi:NAD(P)-dependent dehydrogenase (short-subunit alcohol dehydrogenase family)